MEKGKRYTAGQEQLLPLLDKDLTESEREELRQLLAPRSKYLPATETERFALVAQMLNEKYARFLEFIEDLQNCCPTIHMEWSLGDRRNSLYYKAMLGSKTLCALGVRLNCLEVVAMLDEKQCNEFESLRSDFQRMGMQWLFDVTPFTKNKKTLYVDITEQLLKEELMQLLHLKKKTK